ncbi:MAG TPA: hypothetical protein VGG44_08230 [Tepidisphaeraceae bacterium]
MNVVILGVITKAALAAIGLMLVWLYARFEIARRPRHRLIRQTILTPSEYLELRRSNTRRLVNSPSRAPPGMASNRHRVTPGSFSRD